MRNDILKLGSMAFWINNENKIERVILKEYKLTLNGGEYLVERLLNNSENIYISEKELYESEDKIELVNFKDFFVLTPIRESNGLNGRNFPITKQTFTYFGVYKVINIENIYLYKDSCDIEVNAVPFGLIKSKDLKDLNIPISKLQEDSPFLECKKTHVKTICGFNKNISKLFKKITYDYVNMNTTSCKLVGGGGYSLDPNSKKISNIRIQEYDKTLEEFIINANLKTDKILPNLIRHKDIFLDHTSSAHEEFYSLKYFYDKRKIKKLMMIVKSTETPPDSITHMGIKDLKVTLKKELDIKYDSKIISDISLYDVSLNTDSVLNAIDDLICEKKNLEEKINKLTKKLLKESKLN